MLIASTFLYLTHNTNIIYCWFDLFVLQISRHMCLMYYAYDNFNLKQKRVLDKNIVVEYVHHLNRIQIYHENWLYLQNNRNAFKLMSR